MKHFEPQVEQKYCVHRDDRRYAVVLDRTSAGGGLLRLGNIGSSEPLAHLQSVQ